MQVVNLLWLWTISKQDGAYGFNARVGEYGDMMEMGVIDPTKVTRCALQNAASAASLLLTTGFWWKFQKSRIRQQHAGGAGGMGGVGGMGGMGGMGVSKPAPRTVRNHKTGVPDFFVFKITKISDISIQKQLVCFVL